MTVYSEDPAAQAAVIRSAVEQSGLGVDDVAMVEAHGTGTTLGDPIEVAALTKAFRQSSQKRNHCAIGSVKTNIGHLESAAGIAGLIKVALAIEDACELTQLLRLRESASKPTILIGMGAAGLLSRCR